MQRYDYIFTLTSELDEGEWSQPRPGRFNLGKEGPILQKAELAQDRTGAEISPPNPQPVIYHRNVHLVERRYTDWATQAHNPHLVSRLRIQEECPVTLSCTFITQQHLIQQRDNKSSGTLRNVDSIIRVK